MGRSGHRILIVLGFVVMVAAVVAVGLFLVDRVRSADEGGTATSTTGASIRVEVSPGLSAQEVADLLEAQEVVGSASEFVELVNEHGTAGKLRPGIYFFVKGESLGSVVEKLEKGLGSPTYKVTIPEGLAVDQTADLLDEGGTISGEKYRQLSASPGDFVVPVVGGKKVTADTLEGLLFPSTYYLMEGDGATELIGAQLAAFEEKTASLPWGNAVDLGITPYQVVVIASLIEKEAKVAEERELVAAVVYNRLNKDMTLGIDATVRFAVKKWTEPLTEQDLEVDSPYNTRVKKGLPPHPIASPGLAALKAALTPADVDYLYYVLKDKQGHHFFTASYEEFLKAKENAPSQ